MEDEGYELAFTSIRYASLADLEWEFEISFSASLFDARSTKT